LLLLTPAKRCGNRRVSLLLQMIGHYKRKWGSGLPLRHTLTIGLGIASALWHMHPSVVHRWGAAAAAVVCICMWM
jgi:hypothetical protein